MVAPRIEALEAAMMVKSFPVIPRRISLLSVVSMFCSCSCSCSFGRAYMLAVVWFVVGKFGCVVVEELFDIVVQPQGPASIKQALPLGCSAARQRLPGSFPRLAGLCLSPPPLSEKPGPSIRFLIRQLNVSAASGFSVVHCRSTFFSLSLEIYLQGGIESRQ